MTETILALTAALLMLIIWRMWKQINVLKREKIILQRQLEEAIAELEKYQEKDKKSLKYVIGRLSDLGVPGLVLLVVISTSPFAGAAAITAGLAALGGPFGMLGGIGVLLLLVPATRLIREVGLPKLSQGVIRGLIARGYSHQQIRGEINKLPKLLPISLRSKIIEVVDANQKLT